MNLNRNLWHQKKGPNLLLHNRILLLKAEILEKYLAIYWFTVCDFIPFELFFLVFFEASLPKYFLLFFWYHRRSDFAIFCLFLASIFWYLNSYALWIHHWFPPHLQVTLINFPFGLLQLSSFTIFYLPLCQFMKKMVELSGWIYSRLYHIALQNWYRRYGKTRSERFEAVGNV